MDYLGDEILAEILSRLPAKSLMQLKCVKKQFNHLISCPYFAKQQLLRSLKKSQNIFLTSSPLVSVDMEKWHIFKKNAISSLGYLTKPSNKLTRILGSCHGLICMIFYYKQWIILNPTTREYLEIPKPNKHSLKSQTDMFFGFGYDSSTDDYKLLRGTISLEKRNPEEPPPNLDIFSFKTGSWRQIDEIDEYRILGNNRTSTYYNGCVYWLTEDIANHRRVLSFDLSTEKFGDVEPPEFDYSGEDKFNLQGLSCLDGDLFLYGAAGKSYIAGWILRNQTWENVYSHTMGEKPMWGFSDGAKVSWITGDGTIVANICLVNWSAMQYYDPETDEYTYEDVFVMVDNERHYLKSCVYEESLVSPRSIFRQRQARTKLRPMRKKMLRQTV